MVMSARSCNDNDNDSDNDSGNNVVVVEVTVTVAMIVVVTVVGYLSGHDSGRSVPCPAPLRCTRAAPPPAL